MTPTVKRDDFWVLARAACYLKGRGITFGPPLLNSAALNSQVYSIPVGIQKVPGMAAIDSSLGIFASGSLDHVLLTPQVAAVQDLRGLLIEAADKLKVGGHLVILTQVGRTDPGQITFFPAGTRDLLGSLQKWVIKEDWEENEKHLLILKKIPGKKGLDMRTLSGKPRVCIARYGALGDAIIMTPLVRQLAEDGYEVTLNISSYCAPVFEGNPHVSNILIQERDLVPNYLLGRYWRLWEGQYDRYINLSESLEGDLLMVEGRTPFFTSKEWRHSRCNKNYYDYTMERGGYPGAKGLRGELFFTNAEERRAEKFFIPLRDKFTLLWAMNGSSHHKVYPMMEPVLKAWLGRHEDAICVTVGGAEAKALEFSHPQIVPRAGAWSIRESLIGAKYASCVIGPETMMTNAAGCFPTPKIVLLSHSTRENLTKYFENDYSLEPSQDIAPCYPCHQLHYTRESCPVGTLQDTHTGEDLGKAPICALGVTPERLMSQLDSVYAAWKG